MAPSVAERTPARSVPRRGPAGPTPHVVPGGRQLSLIDVAAEGDANSQGLDLAEHIAALERELRYYRRLIPALTRGSVRPGPPGREHRPEIDNLARWLTDGTRVIGSLSRNVAEQRELELRLEAIEQAHHQLRDEVAQLFADDPEQHEPGPAMLHGGWLGAGLVALIAVIAAIASVPFLMDWLQALVPRHG